jgi:hypothetical protein
MFLCLIDPFAYKPWQRSDKEVKDDPNFIATLISQMALENETLKCEIYRLNLFTIVVLNFFPVTIL